VRHRFHCKLARTGGLHDAQDADDVGGGGDRASALAATPASGADVDDRVKHGYADSNGVKIHYASLGLKDTALLAPALNNNWDYVEKDLTITTVPTAGHFVQADEPEFVTKTMRAWLLR
jgi:pimeloyl-ACP methyl ester carboxylesterase